MISYTVSGLITPVMKLFGLIPSFCVRTFSIVNELAA